MIYIEKSLYKEMVSTGVKFNESDLIILPDRKNKRDLISWNNFTNTKLRKKLSQEEKKYIDSLPNEYEEIRKRIERGEEIL